MKTPKTVRVAHDKYLRAVLIFVLLVGLWVPYLVSAVAFDVVALQVHVTENMASAMNWQESRLNLDYRHAANLRETLSNMGGYMKLISSSMFETRLLVNVLVAIILALVFVFVVRRFRSDYYSKLGKYLAWKKQRYAASSRG